VKKQRTSTKKQTKKLTCPKCHLVHPKIETLYDRDEFYLIERLDRLRENHKIKVYEITRPIEQDEVFSVKVKYLD
jgi:hypothetical protein